MFPRTFFPGRYFAPRFWPQSEGDAPLAGGLVCGAVALAPAIGGSVSLAPTVAGTAVIERC